MPEAKKQVECTIPVLPVKSVRRSVHFYTETLGFSLDWGDPENDEIVSVSLDANSLMLSEAIGAKSPQWVWIGVEDESVFEKWKLKGAEVKQQPRNFSWAYEMKFLDPDRNVLWVGTESRSGMPTEDRIHPSNM